MKFKKLGFTFYGYGNVGDDLMLDGFLQIIENRFPLFCIVSDEQKAKLSVRFPQVEWLTKEDTLPEYDTWIGVGDTPVQILSGKALLKNLEQETENESKKGRKIIFVGIGCEKEALGEKERFQKILNRASFISTRSIVDYDLLLNGFNISAEKLHSGEDLANIPLKKFFEPKRGVQNTYRFFDLGINLYKENEKVFDVIRAQGWVKKKSRQIKVAYIANEARPFYNSEYYNYLKLEWILSSIYRAQISHLDRTDDWARSLEGQLPHYENYKTIISSRYHCLLSAAWAGCRVGAISRSSKIEGICQRLGITAIARDYSNEALDTVLKSAGCISNKILWDIEAAAREPVSKMFQHFS